MGISLYHIRASPPSRGVLNVARALGIELDLKEIDPAEGEHLKPWYLELNPTHTVPTLNDNGFVLWDSHAIICYLADTYGKEDSLYPKDTKLRAIVNQILYFDCGTMFRRFSDAVWPIFYNNEKTIPQTKLDRVKETYEFLEKILEKRLFLAADFSTVADLCAIAVVTSANVFLPIKLEEFPKLNSWMKKIMALPCCKEDAVELNTFEAGYNIMINK